MDVPGALISGFNCIVTLSGPSELKEAMMSACTGVETVFTPMVVSSVLEALVEAAASALKVFQPRAEGMFEGVEVPWPAPYWYVDSGSLFLLLQLAAKGHGKFLGRL